MIKITNEYSAIYDAYTAWYDSITTITDEMMLQK